ncbi:hypothetical protein TNCV_3173011 [Trichonephila clavipes]|nr:hypothetical protein TNCV_3173011 [Trichonephila clavipes]
MLSKQASQVKVAREERGIDSGDVKGKMSGQNMSESQLLSLRTVSHESTPSELVYGKNLRAPETLVMEHWMEPEEEGDRGH